jgi:hypothetical protein
MSLDDFKRLPPDERQRLADALEQQLAGGNGAG